MKPRARLRDLARAGVYVIASIGMSSCGEDDPVYPPVPDSIRSFVEAQELPLLRDIQVGLRIPEQQLTFFYAEYGRPHDCPSGCFYSSAFGIQLGEKLGWIDLNDLERIDVEGLTFYSLESTDSPLFQEATWQSIQGYSEGVFWSAFLPFVAGDPDTPHESLTRVAQRLDNYISPHIAFQLLANPEIQAYPDVLELLACLPVFSGDAYASARTTARDRLGAEFQGCEGQAQTNLALQPPGATR